MKYSYLVLLCFISINSFARNFLTFDLGFSTGKRNSNTYQEYNLGVNIFPLAWLSIRNSGFYRTQDGEDALWGFDSGLRGHLYANLNAASSLHLYAGGGSRFAKRGKTTPFGEGGISLTATTLTIGAGVKYLFHDMVYDEDVDNELIYVITVGGHGAF